MAYGLALCKLLDGKFAAVLALRDSDAYAQGVEFLGEVFEQDRQKLLDQHNEQLLYAFNLFHVQCSVSVCFYFCCLVCFTFFGWTICDVCACQAHVSLAEGRAVGQLTDDNRFVNGQCKSFTTEEDEAAIEVTDILSLSPGVSEKEEAGGEGMHMTTMGVQRSVVDGAPVEWRIWLSRCGYIVFSV